MNQQTFITAVKPFKDKMYRLALRLLVSHDEAQDAVQEIYIKLWSKKESLNSYRSLEAFAMTMTKNYCLDRLKSKQAGNLSLVHSNFQDLSQNTAKQVELNDQITMVHKLINQLPEAQRLVIQLRDIEQYEFNEIQDILNMKPNAVRVNLSRARKTIKEQLLKQLSYGIG